MERYDLSHLEPGREGRGAVCLRERQERQTRDGKSYLVLTLGNATGQCGARIWSEHLPEWEGVRAGDALEINARIRAGYRGGDPELEILSVTPLPDDHPVRLELNPVCPVPRGELRSRLDDLIHSIRRTEARRLIEVVLESEWVGYERFLTAPAAKHNHHAYLHGLGEHSIEVAEMALGLAGTRAYSELIDRDAIVAGSLLHDVGKVEEYEWEGTPIGISRRGRLRSHVSRGAEIVACAVQDTYSLRAGTVSAADVLHVQHVIESHHGQREWGAPTPPRTLEAMLIHIADLASSRLRAMADDLASADADEQHWVDPTGWKREPIWHLSAALRAEALQRRSVAKADPDPLPWDEETRALWFPLPGGDDE